MSACAGGQAVAGLLVLLGTLTLALHEGAHAHGVSLVSEGGHLHLVLSHAEDRHAGGAHEGLPDGLASFSEGDHVLHLGESDGLANATTRRADPAPCAALGAAVAPASPHAPTLARHVPPEPPGLGPDRLRTTVLRL